MKSSNFNRVYPTTIPKKSKKQINHMSVRSVISRASAHKPLIHIGIKSSQTCQEGVGARMRASDAPSRTYCRAYITPIDADDARQFALDEIDGGEAKAEAHQEELPSDATIIR